MDVYVLDFSGEEEKEGERFEKEFEKEKRD